MNQPFYIGEKVICVDALPGATVKNGKHYTVYSCDLDRCKGGWYWYVGVEGNGIRTHNRIRPSIFRSIETVRLMEFSKLIKEQPIHAN